MEPPVVPDGEVRAGAEHHAVSLSDVERARRASVLAYCARLCNPAAIADAADATFAEFRAALEASGPDSVVDLDGALLEATRDAAAARVEPPSAPSARIPSRRSASTCQVMPTLLAARGSGRLGSADLERVERHLSRCPRCREHEARRVESEQAYGALLGAPLPGAPAPVAEEPFAPGDPEPEVTAVGPMPEEPPAREEPVESPAEDWAEEEEPQPAAEQEPDTFVVEEPELTVGAAPRSEPAASERAPRDRGRFAIVAVLAVGVLIFAVGLFQLLSGDDESTTRTSRPAAPAPSPAAPAAAPAAAEPSGPSRAELRFRARLRALGDRELGPGTTGADVRALQKLLGVQQTGNYGELTAYAVGQFQADNGLPETGIADEAMKRKLARRRRPPRNAPTPPPAATPTPPPADDAAPPTTPGGATPTPAPDATAPPPPSSGTGTTPAPSTGQ